MRAKPPRMKRYTGADFRSFLPGRLHWARSTPLAGSVVFLSCIGLSACSSPGCPSDIAQADLFVLVEGADGPTSCADDLISATLDDAEVEVICGTTTEDAPDCACAVRIVEDGDYQIDLIVDGAVAESQTVSIVQQDCGPGADDVSFTYPAP